MPRNRSCGAYGPGHLMHWIQAKKSHEDAQPIIKVKVVAVHDDGRAEIEDHDLKLTLWYHDPNHLRSALCLGGRADQEAERIAARDKWQDHGLVFASELGTPVDPRNILRTIQIAARRAPMSDIGVHTLRHSAAVAWLESGVHIKAVADLLGHSSIAITGDIYGHTSDNTARAAVEGLADRLGLLD